VFRRIENDTESLIVHRDTASILSRCTDSLSKISIIFTFDGELFASRVYDRAIRGSLKQALRRQQANTLTRVNAVGVRILEESELEAKRRSQAIDLSLEDDAKRLSREVKILLLGSEDSGKEIIVKQMKRLGQSGYTTEELQKHRHTIYNNVIDCAKALIAAMAQFDIQPQNEGNKEYCDYLLEYSIDSDPGTILDPKVGQAISSVWHDPCIEEVMEHSDEFYLMDSAP
jgi:hypothetical protein